MKPKWAILYALAKVVPIWALAFTAGWCFGGQYGVGVVAILLFCVQVFL